MAQVLDHKWEQNNLGTAPYTLVGIWSAPSRAMLEANPAAYNNIMDHRPKVCHMSCDHCGTGIVHHFIVKSSDGKEFCVGSSCIAALNDVKLIDAAKKEQNRLNREKAKAKRIAEMQAKQAAYEAELDAQRERNGGLTDHEVEVENRKKAALEAKKLRAEIAAPIIAVLETQAGDFCASMVDQLKNKGYVSYNCQNIIMEIAAKKHGRKNSKAYKEAFNKIVPEYQAIFDKLKGI